MSHYLRLRQYRYDPQPEPEPKHITLKQTPKNTPPPDRQAIKKAKDSLPTASAVLKTDSHYYRWVVLSCPHCQGEHWHNGGRLAKDPRQMLNQDVKYCPKSFPSQKGYQLVEHKGPLPEKREQFPGPSDR